MTRVLGSLAIHAVIGLVIGLVLVCGRGPRDDVARQDRVVIEVVASPPSRGRPAAPLAGGVPAGPPASVTPPRASGAAPGLATHARTDARHALARARTDAPARTDARHALARARKDARSALRSISWTAAGDGADDGAGDLGAGGGGAGIGFGDGGRIAVARELPALPPAPVAAPPRPSRARPPQLIYPSRRRDAGDDRLFVARVTIDTDGYVVGARLVRGRGGPRDDLAAELIFRFRYRPALDAAGQPIRATIEQPFHVGR